ncbi:MAG: hypothetical protein S0880_33300 [Actinomycetota bacterium]|nr:hypothetical protein [Actinomycetota bacterium]
MKDQKPCHEVTLLDQRVELVHGADAYQPEGHMTTFFRTDGERAVVDAWSTRVASFRTAEILMIRRTDRAVEAAPGHVPTLRSA